MSDNEVIAASLQDVQKALIKVANNRQETVTATILQRQKGLVLERRFYDDFERARVLLLEAARALDEQMNNVRQADYAAWVKILGDFNKVAAAVPGVNMSSIAFFDLIEAAVPPIPVALMAPVESAASAAAVRQELARYETKPGTGLNGLGAFPALLAPLATGCGAAIAGAAAATAGIGGLVVAIGCVLAAAAIIIATAAVVIKLINRVPTSAATALAAADSLESALEQVNDTCKRNKLSPADCAELAKQAAKNTKPPKGNIDIPWDVVALAGAGLALWFFWPAIVGKVRASRSSQVAGLRRRRARA
jgi:hypothetical protein